MYKPRLVIPPLLVLVFILGLLFGLSYPRRQLETTYSARPSAKELRQRIFGTNYLHLKGVVSGVDTQLAEFDKIQSTGAITLSYVGGLADSDCHLHLQGDGQLYSEMNGKRQLITTLEPGRCKAFFRRVLTSGILNYSEAVIELKKDLEQSTSLTQVTDGPDTIIHIVVPELKVDTTISVYAPKIEAENYPDIIEFRLVMQIEKEILEIVPKDYLLWK